MVMKIKCKRQCSFF